MLKKNVFLVSGRTKDAGSGELRGVVLNRVVCSEGEEGVRKFLAKELPLFSIIAIVGLEALESQVRRIKGALAGDETSWPVAVDPALLRAFEAAAVH